MIIYNLPTPKSIHYFNRYIKLINHYSKIKFEGYTETHHILPKSMGGTDCKDNLIILSARLHFIAHYLLFKAYQNYLMSSAFIMMKSTCNNQQRYFNSKLYESGRISFSIIQSKRMLGENNPNYGNYWTDEQKLKISIKNKGRRHTKESKRKLSLAFTGEKNHQYGKVGELSPNFGKPLSEETKQKISNALKGRVVPEEQRVKMSLAKQNIKGENHPNFGKKYNMKSSTCPHCGKTGSQNMKRYHFDNCKHK